MNAKLADEKHAHHTEVETLRAEMARQQRDIALLRSQLHSRDHQLGELSGKLKELKTTTAGAASGGGRGGGSRGHSDLSHNSVHSHSSSIKTPPLSPSQVRLSSLAKPSRQREKVRGEGGIKYMRIKFIFA
jgi:hypothetical protein